MLQHKDQESIVTQSSFDSLAYKYFAEQQDFEVLCTVGAGLPNKLQVRKPDPRVIQRILPVYDDSSSENESGEDEPPETPQGLVEEAVKLKTEAKDRLYSLERQLLSVEAPRAQPHQIDSRLISGKFPPVVYPS